MIFELCSDSNCPVRYVIPHRIGHVTDEPAVERQSDDRGDETFGHGERHVHAKRFAPLGDEVAVPHDDAREVAPRPKGTNGLTIWLARIAGVVIQLEVTRCLGLVGFRKRDRFIEFPRIEADLLRRPALPVVEWRVVGLRRCKSSDNRNDGNADGDFPDRHDRSCYLRPLAAWDVERAAVVHWRAVHQTQVTSPAGLSSLKRGRSGVYWLVARTAKWLISRVNEESYEKTGFVFHGASVGPFPERRPDHIWLDHGHRDGPDRRSSSRRQCHCNQRGYRARGKATTSSGGAFNAPNLDVGKYRLTVTAPGFARYERAGLALSSNQVLNVDASIELATTATITEVRAATPAISTETSSLSDSKTNEVLQQLPLEMSRHLADKGFYTYTFLSTGTSSVTTTSIPVINGVRTQSGTLPTMDGIAVTAYSGGASPVQPSFEIIQEVNVLTANPTAEFAVAANYTVVTKSGTNQYHGTAFYNFNGHKLNSRNFFATETPLRVYNNFGGSLGGPIKKNKLFFFGDYEGSREAARRLMTADVPLAAWRTGDFSGLSASIVDPTNLDANRRPIPFPGNRIPDNRISPVAKNVQEVFPLPNFGPPILQSSNFRQLFVGTTGFTRFNMFDARGDYNLSSRDVIFVRVSWRCMPWMASITPRPSVTTRNAAMAIAPSLPGLTPSPQRF